VPALRPLDWGGTATALLLAALWGANPVAIKVGLADAPPLRLAFMRFVLGTVVILAYARVIGHPGVFDVRPGEWRVLISMGALFSAQIATMNVGIGLTTAAHGAVLLNSYAVHAVILAHFMIPGDRLTAAKLAGVLIAYGGIVLLFGRNFSLAGETLVGDLIVAASAVLLAERSVYLAQAVQRFDPIKLLVFQCLMGSACFLAASLALEGGVPTRYPVAGRLALLPGRGGGRLQLHREHAPLPDLSGERAHDLLAHQPALRRAGRRRGDRGSARAGAPALERDGRRRHRPHRAPRRLTDGNPLR
jgi:drug/metabolite transporter (DMT)-like permease